MRLPKAKIKITLALSLLFIALISVQCIFVVGAPAQAEEPPYEELIPDYFSFNAPTRVAAFGDRIAVFDSGNVVLFQGEERTVFSTGEESCDKLCLSDKGVYLLVGVTAEDPKILTFTLTGERAEVSFPSDGVTDIALSGDLLYTLASTTVVTGYQQSDGAAAGSFTLPIMRFSLNFAVEGEEFLFLSVFHQTFRKNGEGYTAPESISEGSTRIQSQEGELYYLDSNKNLCVFGKDAPRIKKGAGDAAFSDVADFAVANGRVVVADQGGKAVKVFAAETGDFLFMIGSYGTDLKRLKTPVAITVKNGTVAVADSLRTSIFSKTGTTALVGRALTGVTDIAIAEGRYYVADGGSLWIYNDKGVWENPYSYSVGSGKCRYVTVAPDGAIYASSDKEIYVKREDAVSFERFLSLDYAVEGLNVGIGGKILYLLSGGTLFAYSREGVVLGSLTTTQPVKNFAVDYRGNVFFLSENGKILKYLRTLDGYASPAEYDLAAGYEVFSDIALDGDGRVYVIADHNVLIYEKTAFGTFIAEDSDFADLSPSVSPRFVCEVEKDYTIAYIAPDNYEDITSIPRGTRLMCYATVSYAGDEYLRAETEKGTAYLPKSDVKVFAEGTPPFRMARCLIAAVGDTPVGVDLYDEPSYFAIEAGREPLFKALGKEDIFEVVSVVAADEMGRDAWGFYRVSYEGKTAYVLAEDVVSVDEEPQPAPPKYAARVKSDALGKTVAVYKQASTDSEIVAHLTDGTEIYTLEPIDENKRFIQVLYEGEVCYVLSENLGLGGLSGGQILAIVLAVVAVVGSVLTILILRSNKKHKRYHKE